MLGKWLALPHTFICIYLSIDVDFRVLFVNVLNLDYNDCAVQIEHNIQIIKKGIFTAFYIIISHNTVLGYITEE